MTPRNDALELGVADALDVVITALLVETAGFGGGTTVVGVAASATITALGGGSTTRTIVGSETAEEVFDGEAAGLADGAVPVGTKRVTTIAAMIAAVARPR